MADYKKMYLTAVDAMEKAMTLLEEAQRKCEDIYIETDDTEGGLPLRHGAAGQGRGAADHATKKSPPKSPKSKKRLRRA